MKEVGLSGRIKSNPWQQNIFSLRQHCWICTPPHARNIGLTYRLHLVLKHHCPLHMLLAVEECVSPWYDTLVSFASVPMSLHPLSRNTNTWRMKVNLLFRPNHRAFQVLTMWRPNRCACPVLNSGVEITVFLQFLTLLASKSLLAYKSLCFGVQIPVGVQITVLFHFLTLLASKSLCFSSS